MLAGEDLPRANISADEHHSSESSLESQIDHAALPQHIAIIMDGNGRWATRRGISRSRGHLAGIMRMRKIIEDAAAIGIGTLTVYAFSQENWNRPAPEVSLLMKLMKGFLRHELSGLMRRNIKLKHIGRPAALPTSVRNEIERISQTTMHNSGMVLNVAFNYSGRAEIVDATRRAIVAGIAPQELEEEIFGALLYTAGQRDPDLLIRTSGELRLSNFLLWQMADTELWLTDTFWPDFQRRDLLEAILTYQTRRRTRAVGSRRVTPPQHFDLTP